MKPKFIPFQASDSLDDRREMLRHAIDAIRPGLHVSVMLHGANDEDMTYGNDADLMTADAATVYCND